MPEDIVRCQVDGPVARLILNRPEKRNAINDKLIRRLKEHLDRLALDAQVRVITISGEGPCFCAGIDFGYVAGLGVVEEDRRGLFLREMAREIQAVMNRMESMEKPIVAVIHGPCLGLGLELALGCDFRVVAKKVILGLPEVHLGMIPDCGGTTRLTRMLGPAKAKEMIMLGDPITALEAKALGLVTALADEDKLLEVAGALVDKLLTRPARALGLAKRMVDLSASLDRASSLDLEPIVQTCAISAPDFPEIMAAGFQSLRKSAEARKEGSTP